jgi:hypothetical protein
MNDIGIEDLNVISKKDKNEYIMFSEFTVIERQNTDSTLMVEHVKVFSLGSQDHGSKLLYRSHSLVNLGSSSSSVVSFTWDLELSSASLLISITL